jgi:hypothetical protein
MYSRSSSSTGVLTTEGEYKPDAQMHTKVNLCLHVTCVQHRSTHIDIIHAMQRAYDSRDDTVAKHTHTHTTYSIYTGEYAHKRLTRLPTLPSPLAFFSSHESAHEDCMLKGNTRRQARNFIHASNHALALIIKQSHAQPAVKDWPQTSQYLLSAKFLMYSSISPAHDRATVVGI